MDDAREHEAAYYMVLVLKLLRRLNAVEGCPDRRLRDVMRDECMGALAGLPWPTDDVILADPCWLVHNPDRRGAVRRKALPLADALREAAGRVA